MVQHYKSESTLYTIIYTVLCNNRYFNLIFENIIADLRELIQSRRHILFGVSENKAARDKSTVDSTEY